MRRSVLPHPVPQELADRFFAGIIPEPNSGCWLWDRSLSSNGYGQIGWAGGVISTHRLSFVIHHGPVPDGFYVCHLCDTKPCNSPDHLFAGSPQDKHDDMRAKGRARNVRGVAIGTAVLNDDAVRIIRASKASHSALGRLYGVAHKTIQSIRNGETWKHVA